MSKINYNFNLNLKMLLNKILVFFGMALVAILVIENMVMNAPGYFLWYLNSKSWIVALSTSFIGFFIGYGFRGIFDKKDNNYDDESNFDF